MKHLAKTKLILLAVALVPLLVAIGCGAEAQNPPPTIESPPTSSPEPTPTELSPPLYTAISAEVCEKFGTNLDARHLSSDNPGIVCFRVPESGEYMLSEIDNPLWVIASRFRFCRSTACLEDEMFYLNLLAKEPTLTTEEAEKRGRRAAILADLPDDYCSPVIYPDDPDYNDIFIFVPEQALPEDLFLPVCDSESPQH